MLRNQSRALRIALKVSVLLDSEVSILCRGGVSICATRSLHDSASPGPTKEGTIRVWSWGRGDAGQLGHGVEDPEWQPRCIEALTLPANNLFEKSINPTTTTTDATASTAATPLPPGVCCGISHSLFHSHGQLWVWGKGEGSRLGFDTEHSLFSPVLNPNLPSPVLSAAAGGLHSAAVTTDGGLFTWGYGGFGALGHGVYHRENLPRRVAPPEWVEEGVRVVQVSAGAAHTATVTDTGAIFTWGRDEGEGRLACPMVVQHLAADGCIPRPIAVEGLPAGKMRHVACGGFFSAALDEEGHVWTWGGNLNWELGRGAYSPLSSSSSPPIRASCAVPSRVGAIDASVRQLSTGGFHTIAADDLGRVWTWGRGGSGQLGSNSLQSHLPTVVKALEGCRIVSVAAGSAWSMALSDEGQIFVWGKNAEGQLGLDLGGHKIVPEPTEMKMQLDIGEKVVSVAAGAVHGLCITQTVK